MRNTFENWRGSWLAHYGIPGMKWGVRRYQNKNGSLTAIGEARYGAKGTGASARKMQRDYNNLDKGYARQNAEREQAASDMKKYLTKAAKRALRKGYDTKEKGMADRRVRRNMEKAKKAGQTLKDTEARMKEIESLQYRILGHAAKAGYTTTSKPFVRYANTGRQLARAYVASLGIGGAIGGALIGGILGSTATRTDSQKVKIRKKGDGSTSLVNYADRNRHR